MAVGVCAKNAAGHVWRPLAEDAERSCVHCGRPGRVAEVPGQKNPGFFAEATAARAEFFSKLRSPASVQKWGKGE